MKSNIFFTSDWHLFHEKSIVFDSRPFDSIEHMHRILINNYNNTVRDYDTCYFLGDMGQGNVNDMSNIIKQLTGDKILIVGNHDKPGRRFWKQVGFSAVLNAAFITIAKELVSMSHCPLRGIKREDVIGMRGAKEGENWHGESRHFKFSLPNTGQFHLHGHTHKKPREIILDKQWDVGVPGNKYTPVSISRIESWIATYNKDIK